MSGATNGKNLPPQFDHWHPVARSADLKAKPLQVDLLGLRLALFRPSKFQVAALHDVCPHRGMSLAAGHIADGRLVCPYHGYAFDRAGNGTVPASPRRTLCGTHFDALERCGAIWVKRPGTNPPMPAWTADIVPQDVVTAIIEAPLLAVLDNFTEVEHTPTTHRFLGYRAADMPEVTCSLTLTEDTVRVTNVGPQKPLPGPLRALIGTHVGDLFVDDWTTYFTPPHAVYDHYWRAGDTQQARPNKVVTVVHFTPLDNERTAVFAFIKSVGPRAESLLWQAVLKPLTRRLVAYEIEADRAMLAKLADTSSGLAGRKLGRFDKALAENRKRLSRLYGHPFAGDPGSENPAA